MDAAIADLLTTKDSWCTTSVADRRAILRETARDFQSISAPWAEACRQGEGIPAGSQTAGEEWLAGPYFVIRNIMLLERALGDIEKHGAPRIPGPVSTLPNGQVSAQVFPQNTYDRLFYPGIKAEVWMQPGVSEDNLSASQARAYQGEAAAPSICLVLGAGNVSSIGPMDALYKLFVDNTVVLYKTHPLNAYLGPLLMQGFQSLLDWGGLRIVYGGAEEGAYCCAHPGIDEIHITGSDQTVEAIVFGPGDEGKQRKKERRPKLTKAICSELGNVSPVIVVPGPWSPSDLQYHGESLAGSLTNNAGFNCNATRVIIQHAEWSQRQALLECMGESFAAVPPRHAFYPGAKERYRRFLEAHPEARVYGEAKEGELPWTLISGVDPTAEDDICLRSEAFCSVCAETGLAAADTVEFIQRATTFANDTLWGTLNVTLLVHPHSLRDPAVVAALETAIADLRYGTVSINNWAALGYGLVVSPWGAYPGHDIYDIQSGSGVVHNTLMFSKSQKTVIRSPFKMQPKPIWFPSHRSVLQMGRKLTAFELSPSPWKLPGIFWSALRG
jgi:acyl-CoA reductase-like NAD-dependent aldehyde dehydrogenase